MRTWEFSARAVAKTALVALVVLIVVAALVWIVLQLGMVITWLLIAILLSIALTGPVGWMTRRRVPRWLAILLSYLGILAIVTGIAFLIVPPIAGQVEVLAKDLPAYIDDVTKFIDQNAQFGELDERFKITESLNEQAAKLPSKLDDAAGTLADVTVGFFQQIVALLTILVVGFFLLRDGGRVIDWLLDQIDPRDVPRIRAILKDVNRAVTGYVFGNLVISVLAGTVTWVTLTILDVPFAVPLAVLMAFLDLIPLVGATIGAVIVAIVVAFVNFPTGLIVWVIVQFAYQQLENHLVQPVVYKRTVKVHPLFVIVGILIGATLLGVLGALIAIPIVASLQILVKDWWAFRAERRRLAELEAADEA